MLTLFDTLRRKTIEATKIPWFWRGLAVTVGIATVTVFFIVRAKREGELTKLRLERDRLRLRAEKAEYTAKTAAVQTDIEKAQEDAVQARAELTGVSVALERAERAAEAERREIESVATWSGLRKLQENQRR